MASISSKNTVPSAGVRLFSMTVSVLCLGAKSTVARSTSGPSLSAPMTNIPWALMPCSWSAFSAKVMSSTVCAFS